MDNVGVWKDSGQDLINYVAHVWITYLLTFDRRLMKNNHESFFRKQEWSQRVVWFWFEASQSTRVCIQSASLDRFARVETVVGIPPPSAGWNPLSHVWSYIPRRNISVGGILSLYASNFQGASIYQGIYCIGNLQPKEILHLVNCYIDGAYTVLWLWYCL